MHHFDPMELVSLGILRKETSSRRSKEDLMRRFLEHASTTVPFYRKHFDGRPCSAIDGFPVVARHDIASNPSDFLSSCFPADCLIATTTSGTSGMPLTVHRDPVSYYSFIFRSYATVFDVIGSLPQPDDLEPGDVSVWNINDNPDQADAVMVNPSLGFSLVRRIASAPRIAAEAHFGTRLSVLWDRGERPMLITGRPRALLTVAEDFGGRAPPFGVRAVVCSGDNLTASARRTIERAFAAPVHDAYVSQEGGLVALGAEPGGALRPDLGIHLEALGPGGTIHPGSTEGELLVTSADNWAMPIIRYRTGDISHLQRSGPSTLIESIDGRVSIFFLVGERKINPSIFNSIFEHSSIRQFQVRQKPGAYIKIHIVSREGDVAAIPVRQIEASFRSVFEHELIEVIVQHELIQNGGKVQRYVRE